MATVTSGSPGLGNVRQSDMAYVSVKGRRYGGNLQTAIDAVHAGDETRRLFIDGVLTTTAPIIIDRTAMTQDASEGYLRSVSIIGNGPGLSQIYSDHAGSCIDFRGVSTGGVHSFLNLEGFSLRPSSVRVSGSIGLKLDNLAFFDCSKVYIANFEYGIDGTDVLSGTFDNPFILYNRYGFRFRTGDFSSPNAITMLRPVIGGNSVYGGNVEDCSTFNIVGGSIESNGPDASEDAANYGLKIKNAGTQGKVGLSMSGVYFEGNTGIADLWFDQTARKITHGVQNCSFNRILSTRYTKYQIRSTTSGSGVWSVCQLAGCGFGKAGTYADDAARVHITGDFRSFADGGGNTFDYVEPGDVWSPVHVGYMPFASLPTATASRGLFTCITNGDAGSFTPAVTNSAVWRKLPPTGDAATS